LTLLSNGAALNAVCYGHAHIAYRAPPPVLHQAARELEEYLDGQRRSFSVPLCFAAGTPFQRRVWQALCSLAYGELCSYAELAERAGLPRTHARSVARACAANPIAILIPCHRIIAAGQQLGGYNGGIARKRALLTLEGHEWAKDA
ncbi:MAG: methylated-DNA--[protein]-cysteine S-methyltransferase, partial [Rhodocyclaceae bacterium]|nr:methylated-DNA--[protein]-cysteine S-methyltransferase [Rhodocyclaceae bacterium]